MKYIMMVAALALMLALTGCATNMSEEDQQKHTTVFVTMKVIEESSLTADDVLEMVADVRGGAEAGSDPDALRVEALDALGFEELSPADRYLVSLLVEPLFAEGDATQEVELGELERWLDWVEQAAYLSGGES